MEQIKTPFVRSSRENLDLRLHSNGCFLVRPSMHLESARTERLQQERFGRKPLQSRSSILIGLVGLQEVGFMKGRKKQRKRNNLASDSYRYNTTNDSEDPLIIWLSSPTLSGEILEGRHLVLKKR